MLAALLFVLSSLPGWLYFRRYFPFFRNPLLELGLGVFVGQVALGFFGFLLAAVLVGRMNLDLSYVSRLLLVLYVIAALLQRKELGRLLKLFRLRAGGSGGVVAGSIWLLLAGCFVFCYVLYERQLKLDNGLIYQSSGYWDFRYHAGLIQNFVHGRNIPVENESFAGAPQAYHYMWGFLQAIYSALGLDVVTTVNATSTLALFLLFLLVTGFAQEAFGSRLAACFAALFLVTHGSLHLFYRLLHLQPGAIQGPGLAAAMEWLVPPHEHPYYWVCRKEGPWGYNGNMFNVFYFLAERQLLPGLCYLVFFMAVILRRERLSSPLAFVTGAVFGLFFEWHLYTQIIVACGLIWLFLARNERQVLWMVAGMALTTVPYLIYYYGLTRHLELFVENFGTYPQFSSGFASHSPGEQAAVGEILVYFAFGYGVRGLLAAAGLLLLFLYRRQVFWPFFCVLPALLLVNTVQLVPGAIYENHKWLKALNVSFDLAAAYALQQLFFTRSFVLKVAGTIIFVTAVASGTVEMLPYLDEQRRQRYAAIDSDFIRDIRRETAPRATFLSDRQQELHLAGRKVFTGKYHAAQNMGLNFERRARARKQIYAAEDLAAFCSLVRTNKIDYVEIAPDNLQKISFFREQGFKILELKDTAGAAVIFVSTSRCNGG